MDNYQQNRIDLFLRDELDPQEVSSFKSDLQANSELNTEFQFQKQVFDGLNQFRHAQLKSRLDGIDVVGLQGGSVWSAGLTKIVAGVTVLATIGFGVWYFNSSEVNEILKTEISDIDAPQNSMKFVWTWEIPETKTNRPFNSRNKKVVLPMKEPVLVVSEEDIEDTPKETKDEDFVVDIDRPQLVGMTDDSKFESSEIKKPKIEENDIASNANEPIDIKIERSQGKLQYKYFDGKLFLYGDFSKEPYQILEINKKAGREIFLYFKDAYYPIEMVNSISELRQLHDQNSKNQLDILRQNKSN